MYLLASKFRFLEFRLLLSRVAPYVTTFVTTNCLKMFPLITISCFFFFVLFFFLLWTYGIIVKTKHF